MNVYHSIDTYQAKGEAEMAPDVLGPFEDIYAPSEMDRYYFQFPSFPTRGHTPIF